MVGISFIQELIIVTKQKEGEMNMKKKILLGLVLILCCFTGCSSNGSSEKDDNMREIKMSDIDWSVKKTESLMMNASWLFLVKIILIIL